MAGVPIKFRCYRCQQLLGVSRSRAGSVVACPKCAVELIVPEPDDAAAQSPPSVPGSSAAGPRPVSATAADSADGSISLDLLDIRPEDIRVEGEFGRVPFPPAPAPSPTAVPAYASAAPALAYSPAPAYETPWPVADVSAPVGRPEPVTHSAPQLHPAVRPRVEATEESALPGLRLDDATAVRPGGSSGVAPASRSRDMVVPRAVVAAWSLFVILALAMAFVAGLLAGHYVWRVH